MSAAHRAARPGDESRRADLARIHIARKWAASFLGMDDDDYRALVGTVAAEAGCTVPPGHAPSSRFLDAAGRAALLGAFAALGWPDASARDHAAAAPAATPTPPARVKGRTNGRYPVAGAPGRITQKQADLIAHLEDRLDWTDDPARLTGWITRQIEPAGDGSPKRTFVAALSRVQATTVITGLMVLAGDRLSGSRPSAEPSRRWGRTAQRTRAACAPQLPPPGDDA